jgi:hypothetical protein
MLPQNILRSSTFGISHILPLFSSLLWRITQNLKFKAYLNDERESNPITCLDRPWGFQEFEAPRFQDNQQMKVVRSSALGTGRLYFPGNIPGTHFCWGLNQPQGHSAAGSIMSMKNFSDTIGNQTRNLPACNAVPQPTAPLRSPELLENE